MMNAGAVNQPAEASTESSAWWRSIVPAMLLGVVGTVVLFLAVGVSLGLFFGGVILVSLIVPPLAGGEACWGRSLVASLSGATPVAVAWIWVALKSHDPQQTWPSLEGVFPS